MRVKAGNIAIAFELLAVGAILIYSYWINRPIDYRRSWPLLLILMAIPLIIQYTFQTNKNRSGLLSAGLILLPFGIFLLFFSLSFWHISWIDMSVYWPFFIIIPSMAIAFTSSIGEINLGNARRIANISMLIGFISLTITMSIYRSRVTVAFLDHWPILLVPAALYMLGFFTPVKQNHEDE